MCCYYYHCSHKCPYKHMASHMNKCIYPSYMTPYYQFPLGMRVGNMAAGMGSDSSNCPPESPTMNTHEMMKILNHCMGGYVCLYMVNENVIHGILERYSDNSVKLSGLSPIPFDSIMSIHCLGQGMTELPFDENPFDQEDEPFDGFGDIGMRYPNGFDVESLFDEENLPGEGGQYEEKYEVETDQIPDPPNYEPERPYLLSTSTIKEMIEDCSSNWAYVWLKNGKKFWFYITKVKKGDVKGYIGRGKKIKYAVEADAIDAIACRRSRNYVCPFMNR